MAIDPSRSKKDMVVAKAMYTEVLTLAIDIIITAGFGWGIPDETQGWLVAKLREGADGLDTATARKVMTERFMGQQVSRDAKIQKIAKTLADNPPPMDLTDVEKIQSVQAMAEELCAINGLAGTKVVARRAEKTNNIEVVFL